MEIAELKNVYWSTPWLAPIADLGRTVAADCNWRESLNRAAAAANVRNSSGQRIVFCEPEPADEPYETRIARTGRVPTRANLHDFFNALIFVHFPATKAQLNRLQSAAIARDGVREARGPLRDAATLIDENAALVVTDRLDMLESLRNHDWPTLFLSGRNEWMRSVSVIAFGHALLQKLQQPYPGITAHAVHIALAAGSPLREIDRSMASVLNRNLTPRDLMPMPVLGIPGWCKQNENPDFYSDRTVFRQANMRRDQTDESEAETN